MAKEKKEKTRASSLIVRLDNHYLFQVRDVVKEDQIPGKYGFNFPGACSFFGGHLKKGETPRQGFERELEKELPGIDLSGKLEHRKYIWSRDPERIIKRANKVFHGNLYAFLGFDPYAEIPRCAMGKANDADVKEGQTYLEWMAELAEDHFYILDAEKDILEGVDVKEGEGAIWVPWKFAKATVMNSRDKIALVDDITRNIKAGEDKTLKWKKQ